jgi:Protein of unknown function (DUF3102)
LAEMQDVQTVRILRVQRLIRRRWYSDYRKARWVRNGHAESWKLARARVVGQLLAEAKRLVGHGSFEGWVAAFCPFSSRTAARCIRISKGLSGVTCVQKGRALRRCGELIRGPRVTLQSAESSLSKANCFPQPDARIALQVRVDREFPPERRIDGVPFGCYALLLGMPTDVQDRWLRETREICAGPEELAEALYERRPQKPKQKRRRRRNAIQIVAEFYQKANLPPPWERPLTGDTQEPINPMAHGNTGSDVRECTVG